MTRAVRLEDEASYELADAATWYEQERPGLSDSFLAAVEASLVRIGEWPDAAPMVGAVLDGGPIRSARVARFPYRIVYVVHREEVRVLAVAHTRREPRYWEGRTLSGPPDQPAADL